MPRHHDRAVEWPTVALIAAVYATVALLVWFHQDLPWWIIMPVGGYAAALYTSLQHEVLHGHPTGNRRLNEALIFPTLTFWLPYGRYRDTHLRHHNDADLTDPRLDPDPTTCCQTIGLRCPVSSGHSTCSTRRSAGAC